MRTRREVCATWTSAFWERTGIWTYDDGGTVVVRSGMGREAVSEDLGRRETDERGEDVRVDLEEVRVCVGRLWWGRVGGVDG